MTSSAADPALDAHQEAQQLRQRILDSLDEQGFTLKNDCIVPPDLRNKELLRSLHREAVRHNQERSRPGLERHEKRLLKRIADGQDVVPERIIPRLHLVESGSEDELLFRYVRLHWSIPVSAGYGRRMRFLVSDESNGKLIGIFGLHDPIFSLGPRDRWIGWDHQNKKKRLQCVMDLFVLGAVPPYSQLLCGKLVALLTTSRYVQERFQEKYEGRSSYINQQPLDARLALLTTTSALGRSSLYNRLRYAERKVFQSVGFTRGSGDFQFSDGFYEDLKRFANRHCIATAKHSAWGEGFRNRREVVRKSLPLLGLPPTLLMHGIKREIFVAPLGANTRSFLSGQDQKLDRNNPDTDAIFEWFRQRWLLPRAERDKRYKDFKAADYRLLAASPSCNN